MLLANLTLARGQSSVLTEAPGGGGSSSLKEWWPLPEDLEGMAVGMKYVPVPSHDPDLLQAQAAS